MNPSEVCHPSCVMSPLNWCVSVPWDPLLKWQKGGIHSMFTGVKSKGHQAQWAGVCFSQPANSVNNVTRYIRRDMHERDRRRPSKCSPQHTCEGMWRLHLCNLGRYDEGFYLYLITVTLNDRHGGGGAVHWSLWSKGFRSVGWEKQQIAHQW